MGSTEVLGAPTGRGIAAIQTRFLAVRVMGNEQHWSTGLLPCLPSGAAGNARSPAPYRRLVPSANFLITNRSGSSIGLSTVLMNTVAWIPLGRTTMATFSMRMVS